MNSSTPRSNNKYQRDWSRFDKKISFDYFSVDWQTYCLHQTGMLTIYIKLSWKHLTMFTLTSLLLSKKNKLKFKDKPWITSGLIIKNI